jgi:hypothetical protein
MSSLGPYHQGIKNLIDAGYSNLKFLEERVMQKPDHKDATCTILRFSLDGSLESHCDASDSDFKRTLAGNSRRLFILEGVSQELVEKLGSALDIEPEFFANHLRSTTWEHHDDRSDSRMLPSIRKQAKFWTLEYFECIRLNEKYRLGRNRLTPFTPIFRRLFIRNPDKDRKDRYSIGLVSRFVSYWESVSVDGNFDGK